MPSVTNDTPTEEAPPEIGGSGSSGTGDNSTDNPPANEETNTACELGSIIYGDGTCSNGSLISGKTPIGIIFDTANRLAVAISTVKKDGTPGTESMYWASSSCTSSYYCSPVPSKGASWCTAFNCPGADVSACESDGRLLTDKILSASSCSPINTYAANAVNNYEPSGCNKTFCRKNKWFLPAIGDLYNMYQVKDRLAESETLLGTPYIDSLENGSYYSANEYTNLHVLLFSLSNGYLRYLQKNINEFEGGKVRPVVKY